MYSFSTRLSPSFPENDFTRLKTAQLDAGVPLLDLTSSNPTSCFADYPHDAIREALAQISDFRYDPDPLGMTVARREIVRYYNARQIIANEDQVLLTASTSEAYSLLFKLLCDPGDEILIPTPSYPLFEYLAALECVRVVPYHLYYDGAWYVDIADVERQISNRTKAIVIVNPNNPTGTYLTITERDELAALAAAHQIPLISDEVFWDYGVCARGTVARTLIGSDTALSFSLNGLSKAAGMPQLKLAWVVINGSPEERRLARERLEILSDTYLSVSTPVQKALGSLLTAGENFRKEIAKRISVNLEMMDTSFAGTAAHRLNLDGGWSAILQVPRTKTEDQWITGLLQDQHLLVQPGYYFDMPSEAYLVLSLLTEQSQFRDGLNRIKTHLNQNS